MALLKKNETAAARKKFEQEPATDATVTKETSKADTKAAAAAPAEAAAPAPAPAPAPAAAPAPTPSASTAVAAAPATGQVALARPMTDVLGSLKDAIPVAYNTLPRLQVNQGSFLLFDKNKESIGDIIDFELLSYQNNFVISPGDDKAESLEYVKYSADGITTDDGRDCLEYVQELKDNGYTKAAMKPRCVLVLNLLGSSKDGKDEHYEKLYQVDLAPTSKQKFDAYRAQAAFYVSRGKKKAEEVVMVRGTCSTQTKGQLTWTVADFTILSDA